MCVPGALGAKEASQILWAYSYSQLLAAMWVWEQNLSPLQKH